MQVIENCAAKRQVPAHAARQTVPLGGNHGRDASAGAGQRGPGWQYGVYQ
jgi:hypothetical protein